MSGWASPLARAARREIFTTFAAEGRPLSPRELAERLEAGAPEVEAALRELHDAHAIVLTRAGDGIRMAHPFSAWPMGFVVSDDERLWWGGCAWDSFGIVAAVGAPLEIATRCPHCRAPLVYEASRTQAPDAPGLVVRVPRPAAEWWSDVVATCSAIRVFCSREHLEAWRAKTGEAPGDAVELERLWALSLAWYGDRLDEDWAPRSRDAAQAILSEHGFTGPFWALPG